MDTKTLAGDRRRRKLITGLWALGVAAVVIVLIAFERTAILYILSTVSIAALLLIVAFSDLARTDAKESEVAQGGSAPGVAGRKR